MSFLLDIVTITRYQDALISKEADGKAEWSLSGTIRAENSSFSAKRSTICSLSLQPNGLYCIFRIKEYLSERLERIVCTAQVGCLWRFLTLQREEDV